MKPDEFQFILSVNRVQPFLPCMDLSHHNTTNGRIALRKPSHEILFAGKPSLRRKVMWELGEQEHYTAPKDCTLAMPNSASWISRICQKQHRNLPRIPPKNSLVHDQVREEWLCRIWKHTSHVATVWSIGKSWKSFLETKVHSQLVDN